MTDRPLSGGAAVETPPAPAAAEERQSWWKRLTGRTPGHGAGAALPAVWAILVLMGVTAVFAGGTLVFAAVGCGREAMKSYLAHPAILALNYLPVLLAALFLFFLFGRAWVGFWVSGGAVLALSMVNAVKITLRDDPFYMGDFALIGEAGNMAGNYAISFSRGQLVTVGLCLAAAVVGTVLTAYRLPPWKKGGWRVRLTGAVLATAAGAGAFFGLYLNDGVYDAAAVRNYEEFNQWSALENFQSRGFLFPFLHTGSQLIPTPPEGYDAAWAAQTLDIYEDGVIPEGERVNLIGLQLEAFCDLSRYLEGEDVAAAYDAFHSLQAEGVSGSLITNVFAGGTVDTERSVLTGYTALPNLRNYTNSYVYYLKSQGYRAEGDHPGYDWFYNRLNVNHFLGFDRYYFTEDHFSALVDPSYAIYRSDEVLFGEILTQLADASAAGEPLFNLSITYQNHGPYDLNADRGRDYVGDRGWSAETTHILNNYLDGVENTGLALRAFADELEALDEPVVLFAFGDHKPWLGDGNSVYEETGIDLDTAAYQGFVNYYETPYFIWANSAAKAALGRDFAGEGPMTGSAFLMREVFRQCGWTGPAFMQAQGELLAGFTDVNSSGEFLTENGLEMDLSGDEAEAYRRYTWVEYYEKTHFRWK